MRPRFSILALFIVTGYVAVVLTGFAQPWGVWPLLTLYMAVVGPVLLLDVLLEGRARRKQQEIAKDSRIVK